VITVMELSYDEIRRIHRLEKNNSKLVELEEDFLESLIAFLKEEKKDYLNSLKEMNFSRDRDFINLKKMIEEVFSLREKKVLGMALIASRTDEFDEKNMFLEERKFFRTLLALMKKNREALQETFLVGSQKKEEKKVKKEEIVSVKILSDVPSFIGTDMKEYGPYKKNEVIEIPSKIAKLFVLRKLGVKEEKE